MGSRDESEVEDTQDSEKVDDTVDLTAEEIKALKQSLDEAQQKAAENWDLFLRARADSDNIQRRASLDVQNAHRYALEKFAREILLVVDSLDQGLQAAENSVDAALKEGLLLTRKLLISTLDKFGIQEINPVNQPFDPATHEALSMQPSEGKPNQVLSVIQKGFTLEDRVLRPARVIVSRGPEPGAEKAADGD